MHIISNSNNSSSTNSNSSLQGIPNSQGVVVSRTSSTVSSTTQPRPIHTSTYFLQYYKPMPGQMTELGATDNTVSSFESGFSSSNLISSSSTCSVQSGLTTGSERTGYGDEEDLLEGDEDEDNVFEGFEVSEIERGMRDLGGAWGR
jgi:hypothetical protein